MHKTKKMLYFLQALGAVTALMFATVSTPAEFPGQTVKQFDIPAQPLSQALMAFSEQSQLVVTAATVLLNGKQAPSIHGTMVPEDALRRLLEGSGLKYSKGRGGEVTILDSGLANSSSVSQAAAVHLSQAGISSSSERQSAEESKESSADSGSTEASEIVVTGTHIRGGTPVGSPVIVHDRTEIERSGSGTVAQFLRNLPENFSSVDSIASTNFNNSSISGAPGQRGGNEFYGASVNLHGVGPQATLTLVNGHRIASGGFTGEFVDVSAIPLAAVDRIEMLTDGASALYGSDAIAGVANFILRKDYQGAETSLSYGNTTAGGASAWNASQLLGYSWSGGNVLLSYAHQQQDPLIGRQRSFIPQSQADSFFLPEQRRDSATLFATQKLGEKLSLSLDGLFSRGKSYQSYSEVCCLIENNGRTGSYGTNATLEWDLSQDWRVNASGGGFKNQQRIVTRYPEYSIVQPAYATLHSENADLVFDGPLLRLHGGQIKIAAGGSYRREELKNSNLQSYGGARRTVNSAFSELIVPLIGLDNQRRALRKLSVSLAGRYDDYSDVGSTFNPRAGISWSPLDSLTLRSSYGRSFRAATLNQLIPQTAYMAQFIPNAQEASGFSNVIIDFSQGNAQLEPETSSTFTAGVDVILPSDWSTSLTFYQIDYRNRIGLPPIPGGSYSAYSFPEISAPFLNRSPMPAQVDAYFNSPFFLIDRTGQGAAAIDAILDYFSINIAKSRQSGMDFQLRRDWSGSWGAFDWSFAGNYVFANRYQSAGTVPEVDFVDIVGQTLKLRLRTGLNWLRQAWVLGLNVDYRNAYRNITFAPAESVASWTTANLQIAYNGDQGRYAILRGTQLSLSLNNIADRDPPFVRDTGRGVNFDSSNADPLGRNFSLQITHRW